MENEKELKEIQDISELVNVPVGEIVICEGKKIEVKEWVFKTGCYNCCFNEDEVACSSVTCTNIERPDKRDVSYVKIY